MVFQDAQKVARVHLEISFETFGHEGHELLEVAELTYCLNHLRVLHSLQVLFELASERLPESCFKLPQLFREALELRVVLALEQATLLHICEGPTLSIDLALEPFLRCVLDRGDKLARAVQELGVDD